MELYSSVGLDVIVFFSGRVFFAIFGFFGLSLNINSEGTHRYLFANEK